MGHPAPHPHETTAVLLTLSRNGDTGARDRLFLRVLPTLRHWAHRRLPLQSRGLRDTDDLVQDTLVRAVRRLHAFDHRGEGAFLAYLRQILLNVVRDEWRSVQNRPAVEALGDHHADTAPSLIEQAIGADQLARFERALEQLPDEQQHAVMLRIEFGYSHQQIAEALGKPSANAARMTVARALVRLAEALGESHAG